MKRFLVVGTFLITMLPFTGYGQIPIDLCPPVANDDLAITDENTPVAINVVSNDSDCTLDILGAIDPGTVDLNISTDGIQSSNTTAQGSYVCNSSGVVTFTPLSGFSGVASIDYQVNDMASKPSNAATITITVNAANVPPVANAGEDQSITLPANSLTLSGSGSDPDGTITAYEWTQVSGPGATLSGANTASLALSNLVEGSYVFSLKVTDNAEATHMDEVTVVVNPVPNQAPTANAGEDQRITVPVNSLTLSGIGSDPDGTITAYEWTKVSGPAATLTGANTATLGLSNLVEGSYVFSLTVTDNDGATDADEVTVVVNAADNQAPIASAGQDKSINLPVNSLTLSGSGSDADGTITSYAWTQVSGPAATLSGANTATLSLSDLVQSAYVFSLTVTDNKGATGADEVIVVVYPAGVTPANQLPVAKNDSSRTSRNAPVTIDVVANDIDPDGSINTETVDLNITEAGIQNTQTTIHGNFTVNTKGKITFTPAMDYLGTASTIYTVNDNAGATSNAASITVKVVDAPLSKLDIPSGFTPNGDNANETWTILPREGKEELSQFQDAELRIYDKRGVLLYEATGLENPWNGFQNGQRLPADTYFYTIDLKINGEKYKGTVTILR